MIEKDVTDTFQLECDKCGFCVEEDFEEFYDAVNYKKDNDWKSVKIDGSWQDRCPECVERSK